MPQQGQHDKIHGNFARFGRGMDGKGERWYGTQRERRFVRHYIVQKILDRGGVVRLVPLANDVDGARQHVDVLAPADFSVKLGPHRVVQHVGVARRALDVVDHASNVRPVQRLDVV